MRPSLATIAHHTLLENNCRAGNAVKPKRLRIAYITDIFPAISLTFVYLEIQKLRQIGVDIDFYAIWRWQEQVKSLEAEFLSKETIFLSPPVLKYLLRAHCYYFYKSRDRYIENFKLCLTDHKNFHLRRRTFYNFLLATASRHWLQLHCSWW
jgi:hypothetical protein